MTNKVEVVIVLALYIGLLTGAVVWDFLRPGIPADQGPGWLFLAAVCVVLAAALVLACRDINRRDDMTQNGHRP